VQPKTTRGRNQPSTGIYEWSQAVIEPLAVNRRRGVGKVRLTARAKLGPSMLVEAQRPGTQVFWGCFWGWVAREGGSGVHPKSETPS
jgi:hypothetical protein